MKPRILLVLAILFLTGAGSIALNASDIYGPDAAEALVFLDERGNVLVSGAHVSHAQASSSSTHDGRQEFVVAIEFNYEGSQLFADATIANLGRPIFIYVNGQLVSSPIVNSAIRDGHAVISSGMGFTAAEAEALARLLNQSDPPSPEPTRNTNATGLSAAIERFFASIINILTLVFTL
ncbi:MAG: hypothetical protein FWC78_06230 [Defluviitaleaceae bacterium]|nr:hypothetical protein [Defluviitaleaceae bacterium]